MVLLLTKHMKIIILIIILMINLFLTTQLKNLLKKSNQLFGVIHKLILIVNLMKMKEEVQQIIIKMTMIKIFIILLQ